MRPTSRLSAVVQAAVLAGLAAWAAPSAEGSGAAPSSAAELMRRVEAAFRGTARVALLTISTTRNQKEEIVGMPRYEVVRLWGVLNGDRRQTAVLFVFTAPKRMRGTGLLIRDPWDARADDAMWYHMRTFNQFKTIPSSSLKLVVPGTCLTYEDARGFLSDDKYEFQWLEPATGARALAVVAARPLTAAIEKDVGYSALRVTVDTTKNLVQRIDYTGPNQRTVKTYVAGEALKLGDLWLAKSARVEDLQGSVVSEIAYDYWQLAQPPAEDLYRLEVDAQPLLDRTLEALRQAGISAADEQVAVDSQSRGGR